MKKLFEKFKQFLEEKQKQDELNKRKGLNDYNILSVVSKNSNELLHSKMLGSFLDINGKHYQGSLFLDLFLKQIDIFDYDIDNSIIKLEKSGETQSDGRIDLYLTDGKKHIVIENKIDATDQPKQLKRYVEIIYKENPDITPDDLYVIYLSKNRDKPENLEKYYKLKDNYLYDEDIKKAKYKSIHYNKEILNWLNECQKEIYNISNLNEAINTYKQVVEKITGKYKNKGIDMSDFLKENKDYIQEAFELKNNIHLMLGKALFELFKNLEYYVIEKYNLKNINDMINNQELIYSKNKCKNWFYNNENIKGHQKEEVFGTFFKIDENYLLHLDSATHHFHIGICKYKIVENKIIITNETIDNKIPKLTKREWSKLKWYSIDCGNFIQYNNCYKNLDNEKCNLKQNIDLILSMFNL